MPLKNYQNFESKNNGETLLERFEQNSKWINPYLKKYYELKSQVPETFINHTDFEQKHSKVILEIGSYYGEILKYLLRDFPDTSIIGMDITYKRIVKSYLSLATHENIKSLQLLMANAKTLNRYFPDNSLSGILVFFPDPWPKAKHEKHRLLNQNFIELTAKALKPGGFLWIKTDQKNYFDSCVQILSSHPFFEPGDVTLQVPNHYEYCSAFQARFTSQGLVHYESFWQKKIHFN